MQMADSDWSVCNSLAIGNNNRFDCWFGFYHDSGILTVHLS